MNYFGMSKYRSSADYTNSGIIPIEPMTAKEVMEKDLEEVYTSSRYAVEEKLDGVRGLLYFRPSNEDISRSHIRVFTRRISVQTNFYGEKSDNIPHIRDLCFPELDGTVLDCEMVVPKSDFKTVSSILNCLPEEAQERQQTLGKVVCRVFDCLYFKGDNIQDMPLLERKKYLDKAVAILVAKGVKFIVPIPYYTGNITMSLPFYTYRKLLKYEGTELFNCLSCFHFVKGKYRGVLTKKAYFDYIVRTGGEGLMVKDTTSIYEQKRTRGFQKIKKKIYRDVVIVGFTSPTFEYTGKFPKDYWQYWAGREGKFLAKPSMSAKKLKEEGNTPVTANFYKDYIGGIMYGVVADETFYKHLKESGKRFNLIKCNGITYVLVGECEGIDDDLRARISASPDYYLSTVIEVEGNEMFYDTGKIRHPRYFRERPDKICTDCVWADHVNA